MIESEGGRLFLSLSADETQAFSTVKSLCSCGYSSQTNCTQFVACGVKLVPFFPQESSEITDHFPTYILNEIADTSTFCGLEWRRLKPCPRNASAAKEINIFIHWFLDRINFTQLQSKTSFSDVNGIFSDVVLHFSDVIAKKSD